MCLHKALNSIPSASKKKKKINPTYFFLLFKCLGEIFKIPRDSGVVHVIFFWKALT
jgi:hypothetical protein